MSNANQSDSILVIDDSSESLGLINTVLGDRGYTVLMALNSAQAMTIIDKLIPTAILINATMPEMDSFEFCPKIRQRLPLVPIIFMTKLTKADYITRIFNSGINDYITKPIHTDELVARVRTHCQNAHYIRNARNALDEVRQYIFSVSHEGELLWGTPEAENMFHQMRVNDFDFFQKLQDWIETGDTSIPLNIDLDQKNLAVCYFKKIDSEEHLLKFIDQSDKFTSESLKKLLPLTKRESEVLLWVAHGKSNKEIGDILQMSPRTVNKHLEQIYPKIGAGNRTQATSIAIKTLLVIDQYDYLPT